MKCVKLMVASGKSFLVGPLAVQLVAQSAEPAN